jgi:predicted RND superfamily exporter protein
LENYRQTSKIVIIIISVLTLFLSFFIKDLKFDYDFESFFAENDEGTKFFNDHRDRFESDNDFIFISVENQKGVFEYDFLKNVSNLVDILEKDTLVKSISCLTNMQDFVKAPYSPAVFKIPYLSICDTCDFTNDSIRIFSRPELKGMFINKDATGLLIYIKHKEKISKKSCDILKDKIDNLLVKFKITKSHYAGRAIGQSYYIDTMQFETMFFIGLSFVLIIIFLWFSFKSFWGIWIPLTIITASMVWITGFMGLVNEPMNLVLTVLPTIIFVVAMSDVIHLVSKFLEELRLGNSKEKAIKIAYKEVGFATLLTSITTAIGFLTLLTVTMKPVKIFGIYTALGVMFAFVLAYTLLPALLVLVKPPKLSLKPIVQNYWYKVLHAAFKFVIAKRKLVLILFIGLTVIVGVGVSKVETNYFLLEDLKKDNIMRSQFDYFDSEYMGLRPFELVVEVMDSSKNVLDYDVIKQMAKIDSFLISDYGLTQTFSLVSVLKIANRSEHGGQNKFYTLPSASQTKKVIKKIKKFDKTNQLAMLVDSTHRFGRMSSTLGDIGKYKVDEKNERLYEFIKHNINQDVLKIHLTGTGHLLDENMSSLAKNLTFGLVIAILLVSLLMGFLYKSVKMVLIAIVPNVFPLLMLAAVLGFVGIDLKVSTAIIFTISFGIAVDDTIHFMSKFKLELNKGKSFLYALKRTYLSTGRAIVLTTLILCSGFLLLMLSDFLGTFYIGLLLSLTLLFALISDLFILPILLLYFFKNKK